MFSILFVFLGVLCIVCATSYFGVGWSVIFVSLYEGAFPFVAKFL
jgi:hypothetical protein